MRLRVFAIGSGRGPKNVGLENELGERTVVTYGSFLRHYKSQVESDREWWSKQAQAGQKGSGMSFFETFKDLGGGGSYLKSDEKQFLIENGIAFDIKGLALDEENQYGPRYVAFCDIPNEETGELEERKISFPKGSGAESRDNMLHAMDEYLSGEGAEPVSVKLIKPGRAILIVNAAGEGEPEKPKARARARK